MAGTVATWRRTASRNSHPPNTTVFRRFICILHPSHIYPRYISRTRANDAGEQSHQVRIVGRGTPLQAHPAAGAGLEEPSRRRHALALHRDAVRARVGTRLTNAQAQIPEAV